MKLMSYLINYIQLKIFSAVYVEVFIDHNTYKTDKYHRLDVVRDVGTHKRFEGSWAYFLYLI